jgi:hypothetical protein
LTCTGFSVSLCMTCAKRISSALDAVIERIEKKYQAAGPGKGA